jgi:beta-ribofuranosylaminobenzene 5'-phosphate synthase
MSIIVEAPSRIHMGFYNFLTDGIVYGDLGVAIEEPKVIVKIFRVDEDRVIVVNKSGEDISDCVEKTINVLNIRGVGIEVLKSIPRHVGLGSTTQIMMAIAYGVSKLLNLRYSVRELAVKLCRGRDSGVGISVFEKGGFVVNSGRDISMSRRVLCPSSLQDLPQLIFRSPVPRYWRFIVFIPKRRKGFDEVSERIAMDKPAELPKDLQFELYKLVFLHIVPAILRKDIETFGKALTKLQFVVGEYFSKYQGGVFCCEEVEVIVKSLLKHGIKGVGQSSWGPTVYGIVEKFLARKVLKNVLRDIESKGIEVDYMIVKARNRGAVAVIEKV